MIKRHKQLWHSVWLCLFMWMSVSISSAVYAQTQSAAVSSEPVSTQCPSTPIKFADLGWESAAFSTHVLKIIIEQGYGCKAEVVPGSSAALETALTQNDIQVLAEVWDGRTDILDQAVAKGQVHIVGDTLKGGAEQGWYVPSYVVETQAESSAEPMAPKLKQVSQLKAYSHLFSSPEQPQKGRFYNCPTGWVCEGVNSAMLHANGLDTEYENFRAGTGAALDAAISAAYERHEPILFYYWQPAGLMAKYDFTRLEQAPFNEECWQNYLEDKSTTCLSDFITSHLHVGVSADLAKQHPDLVQLFEQYSLKPEVLNSIILRMSDEQLSGEQMATRFMQEHSEYWQQWVPPLVAARLQELYGSMGTAESNTASTYAKSDAAGFFPNWSMATPINHGLTALVRTSGDVFRGLSQRVLAFVLQPLERLLTTTPPWVILGLLVVLSWHAFRRIGWAVLCAGAFYLIGALGLWDKLMQTLALVIVATVGSVLIGIPLGIAAARQRWIRKLLMPLLDLMQTMPSFVYLIPILMLFGLGKVPALFATVIYAVPPLIRLTYLGISQVDHELTEAVQSFGVTRWQMLLMLSLPMAKPSIMAGVNQTTMMALSMVVVASMIGAQGLGEDVLAGIQTLDIGKGLQAGVAIVVLAIVMDRITQAYGQPRRLRHQRRSS